MEKKSLKNGSYSILITVIVIAALVVVNLIVQTLPTDLTQLDFSSNKLYTLTETTTDFMEGLSEDVALYYICENGEEDDTTVKLLQICRCIFPCDDAADRSGPVSGLHLPVYRG